MNDDTISVESSPTPEDTSSVDFSPMDLSDHEWLFSHAVVTPRDLLYDVASFSAHDLLQGYTQRNLHGEQWLCIGGKAERLRPRSAAMRFEHAEPVAPLTDEDLVKYAGWYSTERPHYPYLPDLTTYRLKLGDGLTKISWVYYEYKRDEAEDFMDPEDDSRLDPEVIDIIKSELEVASAVLDWFGDKAKMSRYVVDQHYAIARLGEVQGVDEVIKEVKVARTQAIEYIAAINYNASYVDDETRRQMFKLYGPYLRSWLIGELKLGALIDPNDQFMHTYPILKLLKDGCPVYLPWDFRYRPTTGIGEMIALSRMSGEEFVRKIDRAFPLPEAERGAAPPGSLLSRLSSAEETSPTPIIERLKNLVTTGDCLFGETARPSAFDRWNKSIAWDKKVTQHGYLILDPFVEAKLRHYALTRVLTEDDPAAAILGEALRRGLPFTIAYPGAACPLFHPNKESWEMDEPPNFDALVSGPFLSSRVPPKRSWAKYCMRATETMRREEAIGVIPMGTLAARLALEWGPKDLTQRLLKGPSSRAYPLKKTAYRDQNLYADQPTLAVVSILLGVVEGKDNASKRFWFPPLELAAKYLTPNGEWDRISEQWFVERLDLVNKFATPNAKPLTWGKWAKVLKKRVRRRVASRSSIQPTEDDVLEYRQDLIDETGRSWDLIKMSDIRANVVRDQGVLLNASA